MDCIEISGYKSINKERIDLNSVNVLIGANGSGKSNFISFFTLLNRLYNRKLNTFIELAGGAGKILHKGLKKTGSISFKIEFDNGNYGYSSEITAGTDGFIFTKEELFNNNNSWDISGNSKESLIKNSDNKVAKYIIEHLQKFRKYHFHDTSKNSPFVNLSNIENDIYFLYSDGSNIASFLYYIRENHKIIYDNIVKTIRSVAPYFSDFYLLPNKENYVKLQWTDNYSETIYGAADLSDGTMRFIALAVLFMQPELPGTLIIDEPELGLHPKAVTKLAGLIKSAASKGCQVVVATQSTDLISHFNPEDIITVDMINGETKFKRLNSADLSMWLEEYTLDDLWRRNIITTGQTNY